MISKLRILFSALGNIFQRAELVYVVEYPRWAIFWNGKYITEALKTRFRTKIAATHYGARNCLLHFGSVNTFIGSDGPKKVHPSNRVILTWFHVDPADVRVQWIPALNEAVSFVHTSSHATKNTLMQHGLQEQKIKVIPLGADTALFQPLSEEEKQQKCQQFNIPTDAVVIGSFQKDGEGWGEGKTPKHIKGPDLFCQTVAKIAEQKKVHVLLTGPARGYVKDELAARNIPYTHTFVPDYKALPPFYGMCDMYIVSSRVEGGPLALLEAPLCGVPVVTTCVGMAPDIEFSCTPVSDDATMVGSLASEALRMLDDASYRAQVLAMQSQCAKKHSWQEIADQYADALYAT